MKSDIQPPIPHRDLGNGLLLRPVTEADIEPLAAFQVANMHFPMGFHIREWLRPDGDHPFSDPAGFTLVEETTTGAIVSAACLLPQTLTYDGIPLPAGRAEAVATRPDYRQRGLVRAQFDVLHAWAESRGQMLQIVEGATWLYRRFGYQPAVDNYGEMNSGGRVALRQRLPRLRDAEAEPFSVVRATPADLPFVRELFEQSRQRYCVATAETQAVWEFLLRGGESGFNRWYDLRIIRDRGAQPVGFVLHDPWGCGRVFLFEVREGVSWLAVTPSVLRALFAECDRIAATEEGIFGDGIGFCLAPGHPVFAVAPDWLTPHYDRHCVWGVRVPDLPRLLGQILPALNARLAASPLAGHTGELRINLYGSGILFTVADGSITGVASWSPAPDQNGDAGFVDSLFLPLLFGQRSLEQIQETDRDCRVASNEARVLLNILFPRRPSHLGPLSV